MDPASKQYRHDITGLRAIAVVAVFAYHLDLAGFAGGFVGVDVFFVISGYVISRLIAGEVSRTGSFDYGHFYLRRLRRLYPSLLAMLAATFAAAAFILSPDDLRDLAAAALSTIFMLSNLFFWDRVDYFANFDSVNPLLHTWTLAVEEQFYLVWPLVVVALMRLRPNRIRFALLAIIMLGLASNLVAWHGFADLLPAGGSLQRHVEEKAAATIFYLTPFRFFEFAIGALVLWLPPLWRRGAAAEILTIAGLAAIVASIALLDSTILFPAHNALLPCIGTALVIHAGENARSAWLLRTPVFRRVGELSYVIYLVHWPAIVLVDYQFYDEGAPLRTALVLAISAVATLAIHYLVERRFRYPTHRGEGLRSRFGAAVALVAAAMLVPLGSAWMSGGWLWRVPASIRTVLATEVRLRDETETIFDTEVEPAFSGPFVEDGRRKVLLVGDSMAKDIANGLFLNEGWRERAEVALIPVEFSCQLMIADRRTLPGYHFNKSFIEPCERSLDALFASPMVGQADAILITHNWYRWIDDDGVVAAIEKLKSLGHAEIFVFGKRRWLREKVSAMILRRGTFERVGRDAYDNRTDETALNARIRAIAERTGATYLDWEPVQCIEAERICPAVEDGLTLYRDPVHFTAVGARVFIRRLLALEPYRKALLGTN
ncbi:MAG: acyltransferase family protein [Flavobacteriaceae bacterium]